MKKLWILILALLLLSGCAAEETFETVSDEYAVPASAVVYDVNLALPDTAAKQTIQQDTDVLYICDGYLLTIQKMDGGDLARTVKRVTGFDKDALTMIQTDNRGITNWHCAWTTTGESGHQVCRAVILDDGTYHHVVTVMADHTVAGELAQEWQEVLGTVTLVSTVQ